MLLHKSPLYSLYSLPSVVTSFCVCMNPFLYSIIDRLCSVIKAVLLPTEIGIVGIRPKLCSGIPVFTLLITKKFNLSTELSLDPWITGIKRFGI